MYTLALESLLLNSSLAVFECAVDDLFFTFPGLLFEESNSVAWAQLHCLYRTRRLPKTIVQVISVELSWELVSFRVKVPLRQQVAVAAPENSCSHRAGVIWADWYCVVTLCHVLYFISVFIYLFSWIFLFKSVVLTASKANQIELIYFFAETKPLLFLVVYVYPCVFTAVYACNRHRATICFKPLCVHEGLACLQVPAEWLFTLLFLSGTVVEVTAVVVGSSILWLHGAVVVWVDSALRMLVKSLSDKFKSRCCCQDHARGKECDFHCW